MTSRLTFQASDVLALTGLSPSQLREWTSRRGIIPVDEPARGRGKHARYAGNTVLVLRVLMELKRTFRIEIAAWAAPGTRLSDSLAGTSPIALYGKRVQFAENLEIVAPPGGTPVKRRSRFRSIPILRYLRSGSVSRRLRVSLAFSRWCGHDRSRDPIGLGSRLRASEAPPFGDGEHRHPERHRVLLDGGTGTFMLSVSDLPEASTAASWAWSSGVTHHVGIGPDVITVLRWDRTGPPRTFTRRSVEAQLDAFYTFLLNDGIERGRRIVRHVIELFQSVRAAVSTLDAPDEASLGMFLLALDDLAQASDGAQPRPFRFHPMIPHLALRRVTPRPPRGRARAFQPSACRREDMDLHAALSIRHAGAVIFQQAHFELLRPPDLDLLGQARGASLVRRGAARTLRRRRSRGRSWNRPWPARGLAGSTNWCCWIPHAARALSCMKLFEPSDGAGSRA